MEPFLLEARALLLQAKNLSTEKTRIEKVESMVQFYLNNIHRINARPITELTVKKIWDHFQTLTTNLKSGGKINDLPTLKLAEYETKNWIKSNPDKSLGNLKSWVEGAQKRFEWLLEELPESSNLKSKSSEILAFYKGVLEEINSFIEPGYRASKDSLDKLRTLVVTEAQQLAYKQRFSRAPAIIPKLVRVPKQKDPGDNPNILAFEVFLNEPASVTLELMKSGLYLVHGLHMIHSTLHWLGRLPVSEDVQQKARNISEEAKNDAERLDIKLGLAALEKTNSLISPLLSPAWRTYKKYYSKEFQDAERHAGGSKVFGHRTSSY